jgi:hypothetical protein
MATAAAAGDFILRTRLKTVKQRQTSESAKFQSNVRQLQFVAGNDKLKDLSDMEMVHNLNLRFG